jgi:purine-nucleoside phosphorylase
MDPLRLDDCVAAAASQLEEEGVIAPQILFLLGTGTGTLTSALLGARQTLLGQIEGVPVIWGEQTLHSGRMGGIPVWLLEDAPGDLEFGEGGGPGEPPWERAFPVWLAAEMGARLCLFTAAGGSLVPDLRPGQLAVVRDHINLSGTTPLLGLGQTRLGPLFPDQSELHHPGLRSVAQERATERGIALSPRIAACVQGPALSTPAERAWFASTGAELFAQGIAGPLLACAHAGLTALTLVAITDGPVQADQASSGEALDMAELVASAERAAPALEDLIQSLLADLGQVASEREAEYS